MGFLGEARATTVPTTAAEHALIAATLGYTTVEVIKIWQSAAPSLEEMRTAGADQASMWQRMLDANYLGAGLCLLIGGTVGYLAQSWVPLLLSTATLAFIALWYRMVLRSDNSMMAPREEHYGSTSPIFRAS